MSRDTLLIVAIAAIFVAGPSLSNGEKTLSVPLGECSDGAATEFTYNNNGACGYKSLTETTGPGYLYGVAPNQAFYNSAEQCGICYEVIGPKGAVRAMVVDMCPADDANPLCHGQYTHFDLTEATFQIIGYKEVGGANITFREVSCDVEGPVKVYVNSGSSSWWMSLLVFNHALGIKKLEYYVGGKWVESARSDSNHWVILPADGTELTFPVSVRITSKAGSTVSVSVGSATEGLVYSADGQFAVGDGVSSECCEERDTFSTIYKDALTSGWSDWSYYVTNTFDCTTNPHSGSNCLKTEFKGYGQITIGTGVPALDSKFSKVSFWIRGAACTDCFTVRAREGESGKETVISVAQSDVWTKVSVPFEDIGVKNGEFYGLVVQSRSDKTVTYYFDDITLDRKDGSTLEVCVSTTTLKPLSSDSNSGSGSKKSESGSESESGSGSKKGGGGSGSGSESKGKKSGSESGSESKGKKSGSETGDVTKLVPLINMFMFV